MKRKNDVPVYFSSSSSSVFRGSSGLIDALQPQFMGRGKCMKFLKYSSLRNRSDHHFKSSRVEAAPIYKHTNSYIGFNSRNLP